MVLSVIAMVFSIAPIFVKNYWYILTTRAILGLAMGFSSAVCPMYSSAIVDDSVKGTIVECLPRKEEWARPSSCRSPSVS